MRASLAIMPGLETARFQLGLLLLDAKRPAEAKEQLAALSGSRDPDLRAYCEALIALADNNLTVAREKLASGLSHPSSNAPLSALMRRVLGSLPESQPAAVGKPEAPDNPLNLGAYRNQFP
jgi:hypothetical protein